jgi:hypothetical protein
MELPFYGSLSCQALYVSGTKAGQGCGNKAYYLVDNGSYRCGMHSKAQTRQELPKNPQANKEREAINLERHNLAWEMGDKNKELGRVGEVVSTKMKMLKEVPHLEGYLSIFPNFKHQNRTDGKGMARLSPMSLGPIEHPQPGLPVALNLENFHQGSKVYASDLLEDGSVGPSFFELQREMFLDPIPHRHKMVPKTHKGKPNTCVGWLWILPDGSQKRLTYLQCRQFYCTYYERLATQEEDFKTLQRWRMRGMNLNILGYDGFDFREISGDTLEEKLEICYLADAQPFGHELVLVSLLVLRPEQYPWRKHRTEEF